jgi:SAM-dependent methyltransferase
MQWESKNIAGKDISAEYSSKYGLASDYQEAQKAIYAVHEIRDSFKKAVMWLGLKKGETVLDLGINNGYEFRLMKEFLPGVIQSLSIIGLDIIEDVLKEACHELGCDQNPKVKMIKGDMRSFSGVDISTGELFSIADDSIDVVIALASLQSTSVMTDIRIVLEALIKKLKPGGRLLISVPNCHTDSSGRVVKGLFDAQSQSARDISATDIIERIKEPLLSVGFSCQETGELARFMVFQRAPV